jgi:ABC-type multidrug transport system fused ATPase/permease subunit
VHILIRSIVSQLSRNERLRLYRFLVARSLVGLLDLFAIFLVGHLATSIALFATLGSDPNRVIEFAGLAVPALNAQTLPVAASLIVGIFILKAIASVWMTRRMAVFLAGVEARAAHLIARISLGQGLEKLKRHSREEIYFAVQSGSPAAFNSILNSLGTVIAELTLFVLMIGAFFIVDWTAALAAMAYFGVIAISIHLLIGTWAEKAAEKVTQATIEGNSAIGDLGEVVRESSISRTQEHFFQRILESRQRAASGSANQFVLSGMPRYIIETALLLAVALFALWQATLGDIATAAGTLGVFLSGGLRLTASLIPLQNALVAIQQYTPAAKSALSLLESEEVSRFVNATSTQPILQKVIADSGALEVSFHSVTYRYPDAQTPAVKDLVLQIAPGQQIALIGPSGSGKSTIADLLLGLLVPSEGRILIDGESPDVISKLNPGILGYVPQSPGMVRGSIAMNIALGVAPKDVDPVRLDEAVNKAHLTDLVESLPQGLDTDIGKRRNELSGGQIQRIGLARALYSRPKLLVLDEATSALDAKSEDIINSALDQMRGEVTVVLIAHRLNTVQRSDVVFLVEAGRISASGTFQELLKGNKTVEDLAQLMSVKTK